ncbi:hypothetical protein CI238_06492 [Colletotrichum incanum]|uniref:Uncharacterized protein n=1 Tax=Colletotrichum incanum TaxID=1573173 RepID=A0A161W7I3_COLIC|nr:hypothetical protein CI238_06492 [Colletotrichum incanum]
MSITLGHYWFREERQRPADNEAGEDDRGSATSGRVVMTRRACRRERIPCLAACITAIEISGHVGLHQSSAAVAGKRWCLHVDCDKLEVMDQQCMRARAVGSLFACLQVVSPGEACLSIARWLVEGMSPTQQLQSRFVCQYCVECRCSTPTYLGNVL